MIMDTLTIILPACDLTHLTVITISGFALVSCFINLHVTFRNSKQKVLGVEDFKKSLLSETHETGLEDAKSGQSFFRDAIKNLKMLNILNIGVSKY